MKLLTDTSRPFRPAHCLVTCLHKDQCGHEFTTQPAFDTIQVRRVGQAADRFISCINFDAASASKGSDPTKVINVSLPIVAARHNRRWRSICLQASARKVEAVSNSRANRTERHAREHELSLSFSHCLLQ